MMNIYRACFPDSPSIEASPQNVIKNESQSVTFKCTVVGNPISQVTWWYNGAQINTSDSAKYSVSGPSSVSSSEASLTIKNPSRSEKGYYQCKANNGIGNAAESDRAFLVVQCKLSGIWHDTAIKLFQKILNTGYNVFQDRNALFRHYKKQYII